MAWRNSCFSIFPKTLGAALQENERRAVSEDVGSTYAQVAFLSLRKEGRKNIEIFKRVRQICT